MILGADLSGGFVKRTSRKPSKLSNSLQRPLNAYALAASAAGVGVLALAPPADAKIVYTKTYRVFGAHSGFNLDPNHDHSVDFTISQSFGGARPPSGYGSLLVLPATHKPKNQIWGTVSSSLGESHRKYSVASALSSGVTVGHNSTKFQAKHDVMCFFSDAGGTCFCGTVVGQWQNVQNKYLGLKFFGKSGKVHYGWARMSVSTKMGRATLTGYAYETIPNKAIITGKTKGPDVITVEPGTLGALAAGAARLHIAK
jgi:hypothetical protein